MRPRNKTERRVVELSATLPPLRQKDAERMEWEYKHYYKRKGLSYFLVMERCKEYQVIRYYYKTRKRLFEFMQIWLNETEQVVMAKNRMMGVDRWKEHSDMTIKGWLSPRYKYSYLGGVDRIGWSGVIVRSLLPSLKQRGLRTSTHNIHPYNLCRSLFVSNRLETLFKLRQYNLVKFFAYEDKKMTDSLWQSIRVALRHGYHWDNRREISDWCDMLHDLEYLGLDTRNPHYICPAFLHEAHQHWIEKANRKRQTERLEEEKREVLAYEPTFYQNRIQFMDMTFRDKKIEIQIIPTAMGIKEEGIAMHHCVGGYYNRPDSLILSAKINGKRVETIEVTLHDYQLVQSRGLQNKSTKYHKRIVKLMEDNMQEIRKRNEEHKLRIAV